MALETATYIDQLNSANPTSTDPVGQGASHMRLIKAVLQAQFPNFTAAALASTNAQIDAVATLYATGMMRVTGDVWASMNTTQAGSLLCNGASYPTATYPTLFGIIGYTFGGSGANFNVPNLVGKTIFGADPGGTVLNATTNVFSSLALGGVGGEASHALVTGELAAHNHGASVSDPGHAHVVNISDPGHAHSVYDPGHTHGPGSGTNFFTIGAGGTNVSPALGSSAHEPATTAAATTGISIYGATTGISAYDNTAYTGISVSTSNTGSGTAHNNVPPAILMNWYIKT